MPLAFTLNLTRYSKGSRAFFFECGERGGAACSAAERSRRRRILPTHREREVSSSSGSFLSAFLFFLLQNVQCILYSHLGWLLLQTKNSRLLASRALRARSRALCKRREERSGFVVYLGHVARVRVELAPASGVFFAFKSALRDSAPLLAPAASMASKERRAVLGSKWRVCKRR